MAVIKNKKIILGIDPGTIYTGYCILEIINQKNVNIVDYNLIKASGKASLNERIKYIISILKKIIQEYKPKELSLETAYYGKNPQSVLKLGRLQGAIIALSLLNNIRIYEYSPKRVKQLITGNGNASKYQVFKTINSFFNNICLDLKKNSKYDVSDAIAIALSHYISTNNFTTNQFNKLEVSHYKSWKDYLIKKGLL